MGSMTVLETVDERNKKGEMLILCLMFLSMEAVDKIGGGEAAEEGADTVTVFQEKGQQLQAEKGVLPDVRLQQH